MSVRDEILKLRGVLTEAKPCQCGDAALPTQSLFGNFGTRAAAFGIRNTKSGAATVFFKIGIKPFVALPPSLMDDCPLEFPEGSEYENAEVKIESCEWLTEVLSPEGDAADYLAAQTDALIKERLSALSRLALQIDSGSFSLQPTIDAHVKANIRRISWLLSGCFGILVLGVVAVSVPFFFKPLGIPMAKEGHSGNATLRSTRIARAQAELAKNQRMIVPPGSNVFLMVTPDKTTVFLGEKVTLLYEILTRYSTRCWGFSNEGKFQNFRVERKDARPDTPRTAVQMNGKNFLKFSVGTASLVPQRAGEHVIYPGTAFISARAPDGQILDVYLTTRPLEISVVKAPAQE